MNDRWRLKNRIDPMMMCTIPGKDERVTKIMPYKEVLLVRKSKLEEAKEKYGDNLEVMF